MITPVGPTSLTDLAIAARPIRPGLVSVIIVNYRGAEDTITCVQALAGLDWPAEELEIVVVDNASGDGSAERIAAELPGVVLVASAENTGFAGGCNLGVAHAGGEFVAFINSDARPDPAWLSAAVAVMRSDRRVAAVASKVLDWDGELVDFVDGHINFAGNGYKLEAGEPDSSAYDLAKDVLFFTGSAGIVRAETFRAVGGFDEQYFMFFEDVDLGWRLNLLGHRIRYVPKSLVFHRHHASIEKFATYRERYLLERNALLTIWKNFGDEALNRVLAPALLLAIHNAMLLGGEDPTALDLQHSKTGDDELSMPVNKLTMSTVHAIDYVASHLESLEQQRAQLQSLRAREDNSIPGLMDGLLQSTSGFPSYNRAWNQAISIFGIDELASRRRRILVVTVDTLSAQMAGPAIRAFHIAEELSREHDVSLVSVTKCTLTHPSFDVRYVAVENLGPVVDQHDIIIFQGFVMHMAPWLVDTDKIIVVDIYDPMHLEQLEQTRAEEQGRRTELVAATTNVLNQQLLRGDFFMCASEEQRHFWLGQLAALQRLNPKNYDRDSSLNSLLAVCPFGLSSEPPQQLSPAIRGVVPGIGPDDKVIIWAGGVYNWFDPLTLVSAVHHLSQDHPDVRLFFLGMKHPNPYVPEMKMAWDTRELSDRLGLTGKHVFFNEDWVDYDQRQNYLLDADLGVSTHYEHVETTFSFRTRILDYLWAGLPIVATEGDTFGRLITSAGLGLTVPQEDVAALAAALERGLYDQEFIDACRRNIALIRPDFHWDRVLEPLRDFCRSAQRAADLAGGAGHRPVGLPALPGVAGGILARNVSYALTRYREGGAKTVARTGAAKARRLVRSRLSR